MQQALRLWLLCNCALICSLWAGNGYDLTVLSIDGKGTVCTATGGESWALEEKYQYAFCGSATSGFKTLRGEVMAFDAGYPGRSAYDNVIVGSICTSDLCPMVYLIGREFQPTKYYSYTPLAFDTLSGSKYALVFGTTKGLKRFERQEYQALSGIPAVLDTVRIWAVRHDFAGRMWVGTNSDGLWMQENGIWSEVQGLWGKGPIQKIVALGGKRVLVMGEAPKFRILDDRDPSPTQKSLKVNYQWYEVEEAGQDSLPSFFPKTLAPYQYVRCWNDGAVCLRTALDEWRFRFSDGTERVTDLRPHFGDSVSRETHPLVFEADFDPKGLLWLATDMGLYSLDTASQVLTCHIGASASVENLLKNNTKVNVGSNLKKEFDLLGRSQQ